MSERRSKHWPNPCGHKEHQSADFCVGFSKKHKLEQAVIRAAKRWELTESPGVHKVMIALLNSIKKLISYEEKSK